MFRRGFLRGVSLVLALGVLSTLATFAEARKLPVWVDNDEIRIGDNVVVSFQRTLRVPDDGRTYDLPPGFGRFPIRRLEDYGSRVPKAWRQRGGVMIPMYQREAMWIDFRNSSGPAAVKVAAGMVNAITGSGWSDSLRRRQDYVVVPHQPWLDGFRTERGIVRQFVAMPLGSGATVEAQVTGSERYGGIQIIAFDIRPEYAHPDDDRRSAAGEMKVQAGSPGMGLGEGGEISQNIRKDPYGYEAWDQNSYGRVYVHIVNSKMWRAITGEAPPPSPVRRSTYKQYSYPWLPSYDEDDVSGATILRDFETVEDETEGNVSDGQW